MSRRRTVSPPPSGTIDVPAAAVVCGGADTVARVYRLPGTGAAA